MSAPALDGNDEPAFLCGGQTFAPHAGMMLRDYFAAKAPAYVLDIEGWTAKECAAFLGIETYTYRDHYRLVLSKLAYEWADAMLKERAK